MFARPRPRREVGALTMRTVGWAFRYSYHRHAYVLRGIGNRMGPVLTPKHEHIPIEYHRPTH